MIILNPCTACRGYFLYYELTFQLVYWRNFAALKTEDKKHMRLNKHAALQLVCLYAIVAVVCIPGPGLSARRNNSQKNVQCLPDVHEHTSVKGTKNISVSKLVPARCSESCFASQSLTKKIAPSLPAIHTYAIAARGNYTASSIRRLKIYSRLLLPGYYTFLFRYTPF